MTLTSDEATNVIVCLIILVALTTTLLVFALGGNHNLARENRILRRKLAARSLTIRVGGRRNGLATERKRLTETRGSGNA